MKDKDLVQLLVFGNRDNDFGNELGIEVHRVGFIDEAETLSKVYGVSDIFVCPSVIENLPYICLEAISCGVPVVAFNTGGIPDIVEHNFNGYLAKCFSPEDLKHGIEFVLENKDRLSKNALKKVQQDFDKERIIQKYLEVFKMVKSK